MATRIADDPDSWGKPEDVERRRFPRAAGVLGCPACSAREGELHAPGCATGEQTYDTLTTCCPHCGVPWGMHDSVRCPGEPS